jgi:hypothetical protein
LVSALQNKAEATSATEEVVAEVVAPVEETPVTDAPAESAE